MPSGGAGGQRASRSRSAAGTAAARRTSKKRTPSAAAAAAGSKAAEAATAEDLLLRPLDEETGEHLWGPHRFPFGCCPWSLLEGPQGAPNRTPSATRKSRSSSSSNSSSSSRCGHEGLYVLQVCSVMPAVLDCLQQQLQQQQQHGEDDDDEEEQQSIVFPAAAASAVYVHPASLKTHLLRPEKPLPFLDVLVVGAPFREGPRGAPEQQQLAAAIQGAPHLCALVIRGDIRWLLSLSSACTKSKSLTRIILEDMHAKEGPAAAALLAAHNSSSSNNNNNNNNSSSSSKALLGALIGLYIRTVAAMPKGSGVCMRHCRLGLAGLQHLLLLLQKHPSLLRRLTEIDISFNDIPEEGGPLLADFLTKGGGPPLLQQLRIGGNPWGPRALEGRLKQLGGPLKELSLYAAQGVGPPPLQGGGPPDLQTLWLGASDVSFRVLRRLLMQQAARGPLLHLDLSCCGESLSEDDVAALLEALYGSTSKVSSSNSSSSSKRSTRSSGTHGAADGKGQGAPLRSLNLAGNNLGAPVLHAVGGALGAPGCALKSLDLSNNPCGVHTPEEEEEEGPSPLQPLASALQGAGGKGPCPLECLFLKDCSITAADLLLVAAALQQNGGQLKVLDLRDNPAAADAEAAAADEGSEDPAAVAAALVAAASEAQVLLLLGSDSPAAAETAAAAGAQQQHASRRTTAAAAAATRRSRQQEARSKRVRSSSTSGGSCTPSSSSSSEEASEFEEDASVSSSGDSVSRRRRGPPRTRKGTTSRLRASQEAPVSAAAATRKATATAAAAGDKGLLQECIPPTRKSLRYRGGEGPKTVGGGPRSLKGAPRSPAEEISLGSGNTSLLSDVTDSQDSDTGSSSSNNSSNSSSSSYREAGASSRTPSERAAHSRDPKRNSSNSRNSTSRRSSSNSSSSSSRHGSEDNAAAAADEEEEEETGDTSGDTTEDTSDSDYEASEPSGASSADTTAAGGGPLRGAAASSKRPLRLLRGGRGPKRKTVGGAPDDSSSDGEFKLPAKREGGPIRGPQPAYKKRQGAAAGGPKEVKGDTEEDAAAAAPAAAPPAEGAATTTTPAAAAAAAGAKTPPPQLQVEKPAQPPPAAAAAQGAPKGSPGLLGPPGAPVSVVAEAGRIGGPRDKRGAPIRGAAPDTSGAPLPVCRSVRSAGPPIAVSFAVGGGPFLSYRGMKGGEAGPSSVPLPRLPTDPEECQQLKKVRSPVYPAWGPPTRGGPKVTR